MGRIAPATLLNGRNTLTAISSMDSHSSKPSIPCYRQPLRIRPHTNAPDTRYDILTLQFQSKGFNLHGKKTFCRIQKRRRAAAIQSQALPDEEKIQVDKTFV